jgi:pyrroline-5-carboxylate reductase
MLPAAPNVLPATLALVGAGRMGAALLDGWLKVGMPASGVAVIEPKPSDSLVRLARERGLGLNPAPAGVAPDALVLAVKPQMLDEAAPALGPWIGQRTLVISILAGKTIANLRRRLPTATAVVRAMPNLPASIGRGATGAVANAETSEAQRSLAHALLASVGSVEWLSGEDQIDAVTAVSGSGPAYVFHLVECLAEAGVAAGLPADLAARLARATVIGAGELLAQSDLSPEALRQTVTSPGGTTAAALERLTADGGLAVLMRDAVAAARRRAGELSG